MMKLPVNLSPLVERPLVSILMPSYNYEQFIEAAIKSVQAQSHTHFELIVCDDGSTDRSLDILRKYASQDSRIHVLGQPNGGVARAMNTAYQVAAGEMICILDADDEFAPDKLARMIDAFREQPLAGFGLHAMKVIDEAGKEMYRIPTTGHYEEGWIADRIVKRGGRWRSMPASALCFRKEVADLLFPLPEEELRSMADAYLYMLAPLLTRVRFINEELAGYRIHGSNLTGTLQFDLKNAQKFVEGMERVHRSIARKASPDYFEHMPLDLKNHLTYREQKYVHALFAGTNNLVGSYFDLASHIASDDLYGIPRKAAGLIANGVALALPKGWRPGWMGLILGGGARSLLKR